MTESSPPPVTCPSCGSHNPPDEAICRSCGTELTAPGHDDPVRLTKSEQGGEEAASPVGATAVGGPSPDGDARKRRTTIILAAVILLALVIAGIVGALAVLGDDDSDVAKENIKTSILDEDQIAGTEVTDEDATCLSDGIVDGIGTDKLQEYGLLNDDLKVKDEVGEVKMEEGDADAMADVFVGCVEAEKMLEEQFASMTGSLTPDQQECMKEILDEEKVKEIMSATFQGDTAGMQSALQEDFMQCVQPQ